MLFTSTHLRCTGILEPVQAGVEAGLRLGLGKAEQGSFYMAAENVVRKKLGVQLHVDDRLELVV